MSTTQGIAEAHNAVPDMDYMLQEIAPAAACHASRRQPNGPEAGVGLLEKQGHAVMAVNNGQEALAALAQQH